MREPPCVGFLFRCYSEPYTGRAAHSEVKQEVDQARLLEAQARVLAAEQAVLRDIDAGMEDIAAGRVYAGPRALDAVPPPFRPRCG